MPNRVSRDELVLVTGVSGQDGFYFARRCLKQGLKVLGTSRKTVQESWRLQVLSAYEGFQLYPVTDYSVCFLDGLFTRSQPGLVLHGASFRDIPRNEEESKEVFFTNCHLFERLLNSVRRHSPHSRVLFLSSAEIFGAREGQVFDEASPLDPQNDYARAKVKGMEIARQFRQEGLFVACAICFNHDSIFSPADHLLKLVPRRLLKVKTGQSDKAVFYDTDIFRDWTHAEDMASAFEKMLRHAEPLDLIVASGQACRLKDFIHICCELIGIDHSVVTTESQNGGPSYDRMADSRRLQRLLQWQPRWRIHDLAAKMIAFEKYLMRRRRFETRVSVG
ncbi:MAG TPA: GDP-mannose 4,6-dehydratase [Acidobacteriota bacterium]|nr:GDP-mannose 4,6-dehydratase [Acidobacteriota bacterium]